MKEKMIAKEELKKLALSANSQEMVAKLVGDVYDVEEPINEVITEILTVDSVDVGEDFDYMTPENVDKELYTLTSDCNVTQIKVSPSSDNELVFTDIMSPSYYVCIHDMLKGKHNVLTLKAQAIQEAMDRKEILAVLNLLSASATSVGNLFTLDSNDTTFTWPKLQEMKSALRKYGKKFVLISGSEVTDDIENMDYVSDKQREHGIMRLVDKHIPIEDLNVDVDTVTSPVIPSNVAYLVAVSDSKLRRPGYFVRRKMNIECSDASIVAKERAVVVGCPTNNVGTALKFSKAVAGFQEYGAVIVNPYTIAKFTK